MKGKICLNHNENLKCVFCMLLLHKRVNLQVNMRESLYCISNLKSQSYSKNILYSQIKIAGQLLKNMK